MHEGEKEKQLYEYQGEDRIVPILDIRKHLLEQKDPFAFKSGFPSLDKYCEGFEAGEFIVISGIAGEGKTTFARSLTWNFALQKVPTLFFSYEEMYRDFVRRMPQEVVIYLPFKLLDNRVEWIQDRIWEGKLKYNVRAVFIDHVHFLVDSLRMKNPSLEIGSICRKLVQVAQKLNVTIFLIAHLTKVDFDNEPDMDDVRDSSFLVQEPHKVFMVWRGRRDKDYSNESTIKICKDRRTGAIGKRIRVIHRDNLYWELADVSE